MVFDLDLNVEQTIPMATPLLEIGLDGNCLYAIRTSLKRDGSELVVFDKNRLEDTPSVLWKQAGISSGKQTPGETFILPEKSLSPSEDGTYASLPQSNRICQIRNGKSRLPMTWILADKPLNPLPITSTTSVPRTPS